MPALPHQRQVVPARYNNTTSDQHRHITTTSASLPCHQQQIPAYSQHSSHESLFLLFFFGFALII
jgi:hypothetical protein